jgi:hypothetical protein
MLITSAAKKEFKLYITLNKKNKINESKSSKVSNIIKNIYDYFEIELKESNHINIVNLLNNNNNIMTKSIMLLWILEEKAEIYVEDKI